MKIFYGTIFVLALLAMYPAEAAVTVSPMLEVEKKIAYQQGQFGALYARCGSVEDQEVIGGSLTTWRTETFRGYNGSALERKGVEAAFDDASHSVMADPNPCQDWTRQAAATWHSIIILAQPARHM